MTPSGRLTLSASAIRIHVQTAPLTLPRPARHDSPTITDLGGFNMHGDRSSPADRRWSTLFVLSLLAVSCAATAARAQLPQVSHALPFPRLASVLPAGGKVGTTVDVTIAGADVEDPQ